MKVLILLAFVAVSHAVPIYTGLIGIGSAQYRTQDALGNYAFGYNEGLGLGNTFRRESGDAAGNKVGAYGVRGADGKLRIVSYVADAGGFRANIKTNEEGADEAKEPANVKINKAELVDPVIAYSLPYASPILGGHATVTAIGPYGYSYSF